MDIDEILIEEVRKHPAIYDLSTEDYKNMKKKDRTWQEISRRVHLNDVQCRKRWRGLRDCYKRCKRSEVIASGSGALPPKQKWKYYDTMSFLDNVQSSRRTVSNALYEDVQEVDDIIFEADENIEVPVSNAQTPSRPKSGNKKFDEFLDRAAASISETCTSFASRNMEKDSTAIVFESLAKSIKEAQMPISIVNKIKFTVKRSKNLRNKPMNIKIHFGFMFASIGNLLLFIGI